jgi:two-component sensor histidine kinase
VVWTERGGPTVEAATGPAGYGTKLVERSIAGALKGSIHYHWATEGLIVTLLMDPERLAV